MKIVPTLYAWLIVEVVVFYVTMFLFCSFGAYYAWRARNMLKDKAVRYINQASKKRSKFEYMK